MSLKGDDISGMGTAVTMLISAIMTVMVKRILLSSTIGLKKTRGNRCSRINSVEKLMTLKRTPAVGKEIGSHVK